MQIVKRDYTLSIHSDYSPRSRTTSQDHYLNGSHSVGKEIRLNTHSIPTSTRIQDHDNGNYYLNGLLPMQEKKQGLMPIPYSQQW